MSDKFTEYPQYEHEEPDEITPLYNNLEDAYDGGYQQGREDNIAELQTIIDESEKLMWHDSKTMRKIKEWLKEQKGEN